MNLEDTVVLFMTFNTDGVDPNEMNVLEIAYWMGAIKDFCPKDVRGDLIVPYEHEGDKEEWDINYWDALPTTVSKMHTESGLMDDIKASNYTESNIHIAAKNLSSYVAARGEELGVNLGKVRLTSNNIPFIRQCLKSLYVEANEVPFPSDSRYVSGKGKNSTTFNLIIPDDISHQSIDVTTLLLLFGGMKGLMDLSEELDIGGESGLLTLEPRAITTRAKDTLIHRASTFYNITLLMTRLRVNFIGSKK